MHLRLLAVITALCAAHASAASLQPVEAGLQPLYDRVAALQVEAEEIHLKLQDAGLDGESRSATSQRLKNVEAEKRQLEETIAKSKALARSPLVMFAGPAE